MWHLDHHLAKKKQSKLYLKHSSKKAEGNNPVCLQCYVIRGIWKSVLSKRRGLLGGEGSLSPLCRSLKSPVPIFIGMPMMMHSDTPGTRTQDILQPKKETSRQTVNSPRQIVVIKSFSLQKFSIVYHKRSPFVQSMQHQRDDQLFSQRMPA